MQRRLEAPTQLPGPKRLLTRALLGIGLSAALLTSACGADATATAGKDKNPDKSTTATKYIQSNIEAPRLLADAGRLVRLASTRPTSRSSVWASRSP